MRNLGKKQYHARFGLVVTGFPLKLYGTMWWIFGKFPCICRTGHDFGSSMWMNIHLFDMSGTVLSDEIRITMARIIAERDCL